MTSSLQPTTTFFTRTTLFVTLLSLTHSFAGSVVAQAAGADQPTISRMCVWNANKSIWRALNLTREQIAQLDVIRRRYPAVVGGQWSVEEDRVDMYIIAPRTAQGPAGPSPAPAPQPTGTREAAGPPRIPGAREVLLGLQVELREVLSAAQLRKWAMLCK
ncbi:MAG: hypothetical protein JNM91_00820 [Flavobacteriales bacterium]|nr:hypothetical protein [Flavobacteriales bacterium]